ncbi:MAG: hypothetical protein A2428_14910 [Bdellovibrionales bacterium RIFOXYC1_FULL_54_43]|nr:MAG: hypothetical protein A2428_14910 [Bdellovibrionales bacterium RIFOXYC1_FULL_54_43]OFZ84163.1 MAG: hypothetical protein A2603_07790 [Bdellovibrionales bacterium RIFOXYD1_FULL_55_31]
MNSEFANDRADRLIPRAMASGEGRLEPADAPISFSRSQLQRLIEEGGVTVDGKSIESKTKLRGGSRVIIEFPAPKPLALTPENRALEILFEDEQILVLNKPPGLTVHPSATQTQGTLVHALLHHVKDLSGIGGVLRPGIVHRIDKDTSGALVITKTDLAHRHLVEAFSRHNIERAYWALCYAAPRQLEGTVDTLIGRNPKDRKKMSTQVKAGRRAVTHYRLIDVYKDSKANPFASWMEARLETGRTHQVRVHLTALGCSLLGDPTYGTPTQKQAKWISLPPEVQSAVTALPGQALHARVLGFDHPITGKRLRFEAAPPSEFKTLLEALAPYGTTEPRL